MKLNRTPRTWSSTSDGHRVRDVDSDAADGVPNDPSDDAPDALAGALEAYTTGASAEPEFRVLRVVDDFDEHAGFVGSARIEEATILDLTADEPSVASNLVNPREHKDIAVAANPMYYVERSDQATALEFGTEGNVAAVEVLVATLRQTGGAIAEALRYCASAADEITATAATFHNAAAHMRGVAADQSELQVMMTTAINDLELLRSDLESQRASAAAAAAAVLEATTREADEMRAVALADVERAHERLMRFTAEIGNVATELRTQRTTD